MGDFVGYVRDVSDAFVLLEAATRGYISTVKSRPKGKVNERMCAGYTIIFDSRTTGMTRWVDGKSWSSSRFRDGFFVYQELPVTKTSLFKKAISVISPRGHRYHLINYFTRGYIQGTHKTPFEFINLLPNGSELLAAAQDYRYSKCFRTSSRACGKLYPAPNSSTRTDQISHTARWIKHSCHTFSKSSEQSLPSLNTLGILNLNSSQTHSYSWSEIEDKHQLALLSKHLAL
ncbi:Gluconate transport-inducing protein [Entomophthora muscae]|uniref:Gluconate transport-inducing protein n=1 Tax=Entomophthora muscae TaxID=34485 RepID=A0ACC2RIM5_9FUNG|nr:Gluconate transport-inducing protein [Entomophthora muscae]